MQLRRILGMSFGISLAVLLAAPAFATTYNIVTVGGPILDWNTPTTWSPNGVPGNAPGDSVNITTAGAQVQLTQALANPLSSFSISGNGTLVEVATGGNLDLGSTGGTVNSGAVLRLTGGTLTNNGIFGLNSGTQLQWWDGVLTGSGTTDVNFAITTGSRILLQGPGGATISGQLVQIHNFSDLTYSGSSTGLALNNGAQIVIDSGAKLDIQGINGITTNGVGTNKITNNGTFLKSGGAFGTNITIPVDNNSLVQVTVSGGSLVMGGTGSSHVNGTWDANVSGSAIAFPSASTHTFSGSTNQFIGAGTITTSANISATGAIIGCTVSNLTVQGGTINGGQWSLGAGAALTWRTGAMQNGILGIPASSTMTFTGVNTSAFSNTTITNLGGTIEFGALEGTSAIAINSGTVLTNSGTINVTGNVNVTSDFAGSARIDNVSSVTTSNSGTATFNVQVNNNGTITPTSGFLNLTGGGTHTGAFSPGTTGTIEFGGGTHNLNSGTSFSGTGKVKIAGGVFNAAVPLTINNATFFFAGTMSGSGNLTLNNFTWGGGTMDNSMGLGQTIVGGTTATFDGSVGPMIVNGGRVLTLNSGLAAGYNGGTNTLQVNGGSSIVNSGSFQIGGDYDIGSDNIAAPSFSNTATGQVVKISGGSKARMYPPFTNNGTISVTTGELEIENGGTNAGTITLPAATSVLSIANGTFLLNSGTIFTPANLGTMEVYGSTGVLTANTPVTIKNVELRDGKINGPATLTISNKLLWEGGMIQGPGITTIQNTATVDHTVPAMVTYLDNRTFDNSGVFNYNPLSFNLRFQNGAIFNNNPGAQFVIQGDQFLASDGNGANAFNNSGTVKKTGGTSGTRFDMPLNNGGSGLISSETANGTIIINGGGSMTGGTITTTLSNAFFDIFNGTFTASGGTFTGSGQSRVLGTGTLSVTASINALTTVAVASGGTLTTAPSTTFQISNLNWSGGTIQGNGTVRVLTSGVITSTSPTTLSGSTTLTNAGTNFDYNGDNTNYLTINGTAKLNNESSSVMSLTADGLITGAATALVSNSGTLTKTAGSGVSQIDVPVTSTLGTFGASSGTLRLTGGGTLQNGLTLGAGSTLELATSSYTINTPASITGTGTLAVTSGTTADNAGLSIPILSLTGGTLTGTANNNVSAGTWSGGDWLGSGTSSIPSGKSLTISGGTTKHLGRPFLNAGTVTLNAPQGSFLFQSGITFTNNSTFDVTGAGAIGCSCGTPSLFINGVGATFVKNGVGNAQFVPNLQNDGAFTLAASTGVLDLTGTGNHSGSFTTNSGASLQFNTNDTFGTTASIIGTGDLAFVGTALMNGSINLTSPSTTSILSPANVTYNGATAANFPRLRLQGNLSGTGNIVISGPSTSTWDNGTLTGSGSFTINSGVPMQFTGLIGPMTLDNRVLTNNGAITYNSTTNSLSLVNGATLNNFGTFTATSSTAINGLGVALLSQNPSASAFVIINAFNNQAGSTFTKTSGGTLSFAPKFTNDGTVMLQNGTLSAGGGYIQNGGTTNLAGGNLSSSSPIALNAGLLVGNGTVTGALTNGGTIEPGTSTVPGAITLNGAYTQAPGGTINMKIGGTAAGTQYDQLLMPAGAALDGTFNATLINSYLPPNGQTFDAILLNSHTGDFATKNLPTFAGGGSFTSSYTASAFQLAAVVTQADLFINQVTPGTVNHNSSATFSVILTNGGPDTATGITLTDTFTGATFVSATGPAGVTCTGTGPVTCTMASLASGGSVTISLNFVASSTGTISNTASVSASTFDPNGTNNSVTASATVVPVADLSIAMTHTPEPVDAGTNVTYTIALNNAGPDASGSTLAIFTASNGTIVSATSGTPAFTCSGSGASASCSTASFTGSATITVIVTAGGSGSVTLNGAINSSAVTDPNTANNTTSQAATITPKADLQVTKQLSPGAATAGSNYPFSITVKNNGASDAANVVVNDAGPAGTTFVANIGGCTTPFPCNLGTLTSGQSVTITTTWAIPAGATGTLSNTATVSSTTADPNTSNNSSTVSTTISQKADLAITKVGPSTAQTGSTVVYTITVTNAGPSNATGVSVSDPTPPRLTFLGNSGACTTPFPCSLGNLNAGQSATIQSTYKVLAGTGAINNTAFVTASTTDPNSGNNSATATTTSSCPTQGPSVVSPSDGANNVPTSGTLAWSNPGATTFSVYLGPAGSGCSMPFGQSNSTIISYNNLQQNTDYEWRVEAIAPGCPIQSSSCFKFKTVTTCALTAPALIAPANNAVVTSPTTFQWSAVSGATSYKLFATINGGAVAELGTTSGTTLTADVGNGSVTWFVVASNGSCTAQSQSFTFNACTAATPIARVVGEATSGQTYKVEWDAVPGATHFELDESESADFLPGVTTTTNVNNTNEPNVPFTHQVTTTAKAWYYRVRAFVDCTQTPGAYSPTIRVVVIPLPPKNNPNPNVNIPAGSKQVVVQEIFIDGEPNQTLFFTASVDRPWLTVSPSSGILPPTGVTLQVTADPSTLHNGTSTGTVVVVVSTSASSTGPQVTAGTSKSVPVSVSLVTPVAPVQNKPAPSVQTLVVPSVGHLDGVNSHWQSDIRLTNVASALQKYVLTFIPSDNTTVKETTISVDANGTIALDDIVRNWYGIGSLGDSANGILEIRPSADGKAAGDVPSVQLTTAVSSRTYNVTTNGTLGQFIPAIPFANFIGKALAGSPANLLSLQQIAQSDAFRTNVGLVEAAGLPATVLLSVFDDHGVRLKDLTFDLRANEQKQLNALLAQNGISVTDGRIEVQVIGGEGKVTAYASVVDNLTNDPFAVTGVALNGAGATKWVLPGVADLNNSLASWRTDMRIFNSGLTSQNATLTFFPQGNAEPLTTTLSINPGEVRTLDNVLQTLFGAQNLGGAMHITTPSNAALVVSGRTFNQTPTGTYGQFIPAVTPAEGVGTGERALQILQVEDSSRFRTNLGIAEVTGKPVTVEVQVFLPDSKVTPTVQLPLAANEFRQFGILRELGLGNVYNARLAIRVLDGDGRITAYGSMIDMTTQDSTYVPGQ